MNNKPTQKPRRRVSKNKMCVMMEMLINAIKTTNAAPMNSCKISANLIDKATALLEKAKGKPLGELLQVTPRLIVAPKSLVRKIRKIRKGKGKK